MADAMSLPVGERALAVATGSLPWAVFYHACYWACRGAAPSVFGESYTKLERDLKGYWCSSMVSSFHAVVVTTLSMRALAEDGVLRGGDEFFYATPRSMLAARMFLGYIASDLVLAAWYGRRWKACMENLVHHVTIIATWSIFLDHRAGQFLACVAQICEITTPFVNQRWFLDVTGLKTSKAYFYNGLTMTLLWFVSRVLLYSYCGWKLFASRAQLMTLGAPAAVTVASCYLAGLALQYLWFYKIVRGALKSLRKKNPKADTPTDSKGKKTQ